MDRVDSNKIRSLLDLLKLSLKRQSDNPEHNETELEQLRKAVQQLDSLVREHDELQAKLDQMEKEKTSFAQGLFKMPKMQIEELKRQLCLEPVTRSPAQVLADIVRDSVRKIATR